MHDYSLKLSQDHINELREARRNARRPRRGRHAVARSLHRLADRLDH